MIADGLPRAALVTGGAKRIGRAHARELAAAGFDVAVHFNTSSTEAEAVCEEIGRDGRRAVALGADLADGTAAAGLVPAAVRALGPIGVLVNNASIFEGDRVAGLARERWVRQLDINLYAPLVLCRAFAAQLPAAAEGVIVNMIDARVRNLTPNYLSYSVSKAGLWAATQSMARDLAPRIRVCGIGPGPAVRPPEWTDEQFEKLCATMPLRRPVEPEQLARTLRFIVETPALTGQLINVDAGQEMGWSFPSGDTYD